MSDDQKKKEKAAEKKRVEIVREFDYKQLPRDEDGKVILPEDMTYPEFLKMTHPGMDEKDIEKVMKKDNRSAWVVRFQILSFVILIGVIAYFMITR